MTPDEIQKLAESQAEIIKVGMLVDYHAFVGGDISQCNCEVIDGPRMIGDVPCFKMIGIRGYVSAAALTEPIMHPCPHCAHHRCGGRCCWCGKENKDALSTK